MSQEETRTKEQGEFIDALLDTAQVDMDTAPDGDSTWIVVDDPICDLESEY